MAENHAPELPEQIPTAAAIAAVQHVLAHGHDGLDPIQHFLGALVDELGLSARGEVAEAERAVVAALSAHPRDQGAIDKALRQLKAEQKAAS